MGAAAAAPAAALAAATSAAPSVTFETLATHFPSAGAAIDLLHVDTEGHDALVVEQALAFAEKTCAFPRHIKFEYLHVPAEQQRAVLQRLAGSGYRCHFKAKDVLCTHHTCVGQGALLWRH